VAKRRPWWGRAAPAALSPLLVRLLKFRLSSTGLSKTLLNMLVGEKASSDSWIKEKYRLGNIKGRYIN